eukprot:TRINITY_DN2709_c0_g1_i2.p1 TRINITY_DN2709_c0_g1~~TRINITY_DN2709_c0_g1_i2.p1  ORF type:complete len:176 (-),score=52.20 TRINITY_DN2709_c0_g1_i2:199-726(-)
MFDIVNTNLFEDSNNQFIYDYEDYTTDPLAIESILTDEDSLSSLIDFEINNYQDIQNEEEFDIEEEQEKFLFSVIQNPEMETEEIEIDEIDIISDTPPKKEKNRKRKSLDQNIKNKNNKNKINKSMVYDILTELDLTHKKATILEKRINKVFMGEEIIKIQNNDEEENDESIDII